jgi:hypothetical protein
MSARSNATRPKQCAAVPIDVQTPELAVVENPKPQAPPTHQVKVGAPQSFGYNVAKR